jgi:hypothetical protein
MEAALQSADADVVGALLPGSDANARDEDGRTAMMLAAMVSHTRAIELLLPHTDTCLEDEHGQTALPLGWRSESDCVDALGLASPLGDVEAAIETHGRECLPRCSARIDAVAIAQAIRTVEACTETCTETPEAGAAPIERKAELGGGTRASIEDAPRMLRAPTLTSCCHATRLSLRYDRSTAATIININTSSAIF